jgi:hypothetical protein
MRDLQSLVVADDRSERGRQLGTVLIERKSPRRKQGITERLRRFSD